MLTILLTLTCLWAPQEDKEPEPGSAGEESVTSMESTRLRFTGGFTAVERHARGEGKGHIQATARAGGFIVRDYWSRARERRIYAGHDVLHLDEDGRARHWWFGSRGDHATAQGHWNVEGLTLTVPDEADPDRRYRYTYREGLAFHFVNEHYSRRGFEYFMDSSWVREDPELPNDFRVSTRPSRDELFRHYTGELQGEAGAHKGRVLFGEWLVWDTDREHAVLRRNWLGKLELWSWDVDGTVRTYRGRRQKYRLLFDEYAEGRKTGIRRIDELLSDGYRTRLESRSKGSKSDVREFRRS